MSERVIVVAREGCFMQTLNLGCVVFVAVPGCILLLLIFARACAG